LEAEDAYKAQIASKENGEFAVTMDSARCEFVFILDRSGSMSGTRINKAKEALVLFLKSLPPNSYFNVISFGSDYKGLFKESVKYSEEVLENAIK
jgi:uncharacterized protein with von Willebrand factor type A (vWA) domain